MQGRNAREELGHQLRTKREALGLSQRELGRRAQVSGAYVGQLEAGIVAHPPSEAVILRVANVLELSEAEKDIWVALCGRIRSARLMAILNDPENLRKLANATGLPAGDLLRLATALVEGQNEWPS
jgi:transcriptional regulator with XRE-family HTH domain